MEHWQTILIVKGTAGKIKLFARKREDEQWEFYRSGEISTSQQSEAVIVNTFQEALDLLGKSWKFLSPEYIHPDFKKPCWHYLSTQNGLFNRVNWRKACL